MSMQVSATHRKPKPVIPDPKQQFDSATQAKCLAALLAVFSQIDGEQLCLWNMGNHRYKCWNAKDGQDPAPIIQRIVNYAGLIFPIDFSDSSSSALIDLRLPVRENISALPLAQWLPKLHYPVIEDIAANGMPSIEWKRDPCNILQKPGRSVSTALNRNHLLYITPAALTKLTSLRTSHRTFESKKDIEQAFNFFQKLLLDDKTRPLQKILMSACYPRAFIIFDLLVSVFNVPVEHVQLWHLTPETRKRLYPDFWHYSCVCDWNLHAAAGITYGNVQYIFDPLLRNLVTLKAWLTECFTQGNGAPLNPNELTCTDVAAPAPSAAPSGNSKGVAQSFSEISVGAWGPVEPASQTVRDLQSLLGVMPQRLFYPSERAEQYRIGVPFDS